MEVILVRTGLGLLINTSGLYATHRSTAVQGEQERVCVCAREEERRKERLIGEKSILLREGSARVKLD